VMAFAPMLTREREFLGTCTLGPARANQENSDLWARPHSSCHDFIKFTTWLGPEEVVIDSVMERRIVTSSTATSPRLRSLVNPLRRHPS
jgi:hypothetical protein